MGNILKHNFEMSFVIIIVGKEISDNETKILKTLAFSNFRFDSMRRLSADWVTDNKAMPKISAQMPIYFGKK